MDSDSEEIDELDSDSDGGVPSAGGPTSPALKEAQLTRLTSILRERIFTVERLRASQRLPFILDHLASGFKSYVQRHYPAAAAREECPGYKIDYYLISDEEEETDTVYQGEAWSWSCPLCRLFGAFRSRAELNVHLAHGHGDFVFSWVHDNVRQLSTGKSQWHF